MAYLPLTQTRLKHYREVAEKGSELQVRNNLKEICALYAEQARRADELLTALEHFWWSERRRPEHAETALRALGQAAVTYRGTE